MATAASRSKRQLVAICAGAKFSSASARSGTARGSAGNPTSLLAYAPRETRTPTPHTRDKALNLASCVFAVSVVSRLSVLRGSRETRWTVWTFCDGVDVANVLPTNRPGEIAAAASLAGGGHSQDRADPNPRLLPGLTAVAAVQDAAVRHPCE